MKTLFILLALSATTLLATTVRAQSADEKALRKTVDDSRAAFDKRDLNAFVTYFVNSPDLYYQVTTGDHQLILAHGFENMKKMVGGYMKDNPTPAKAGSFKTTDLRLRVNGNVAFLSGNSVDSSSNESSQDFIILEKQAGNGSGAQWKISALTAQYYEMGKRIEVN